jgi:hypothetical protein
VPAQRGTIGTTQGRVHVDDRLISLPTRDSSDETGYLRRLVDRNSFMSLLREVIEVQFAAIRRAQATQHGRTDGVVGGEAPQLLLKLLTMFELQQESPLTYWKN